MNAEHLLDSLRFRDAVDTQANTWRNKKARWPEKVKALQAFLDIVEGSKPSHIASPTVELPTRPPDIQTDAPQDINSLSDIERARIFDLDMPPIPPKATPEILAKANLEAREGKLAQLKPLLPTLGLGKKGFVIVPSDFPVHDMPQYLDGTGYGVTDTQPVNLEIASKLVGGHFDAATGIGGAKVASGPKSGWKVELIRVG